MSLKYSIFLEPIDAHQSARWSFSVALLLLESDPVIPSSRRKLDHTTVYNGLWSTQNRAGDDADPQLKTFAEREG